MAFAGLLAAMGCVSSRMPASRVPSAQCLFDPGIAGTWTDRRITQLGPAWVRLDLDCDCRYAMRIQLLWFRFTEQGLYRAAGNALTFERASGRVTVMPCRRDGTDLALSEGGSEVHRYTRSGGVRSCHPPAAAHGARRPVPANDLRVTQHFGR
jgi:hypothetical protein